MKIKLLNTHKDAWGIKIQRKGRRAAVGYQLGFLKWWTKLHMFYRVFLNAMQQEKNNAR